MGSRVLKDADNQITQKYNALTHRAVDLVKYKGKTCPIIAHTYGTVIWTQTGQKNNKGSKGNKSYGNCVKIKHSNGYRTLYAHLKNGIKVKKGQKVKQGDLLGHMGNTGKAAGNHLHYEYYKGGASTKYRVDPEKYTYVYKDQTVSKSKEATKGLKYAEGTNSKR